MEVFEALTGWVRRGWKLIQHARRQRPLPLTVALLIVTFMGATIHEALIDWLVKTTGFTKPQLAIFAAIAIVLLALVTTFTILTGDPAMSSYAGSEQDAQSINQLTKHDLERLRDGLHLSLYGEEAPDHDEIVQMYGLNPTMGVAIRSRELDDFIAFAAAWPLRPEIGRKIESGEMNESDLRAEHILPDHQDSAAIYILVPAYGVSSALPFARRSAISERLEYNLAFLVRRKYLTNKKKKLTILATGYSTAGENKCINRFGMRRVGSTFMSGVSYPIYARIVTQSEFESHILDGGRRA